VGSAAVRATTLTLSFSDPPPFEPRSAVADRREKLFSPRGEFSFISSALRSTKVRFTSPLRTLTSSSNVSNLGSLKDTKEAYPVEDSPTGPPVDVNLLSSLVHWASLAKQRVGEQQLKDILELYIQSGHSRPELQGLLLHVSDMVDEATPEGGERSEDWVDLMFHLHGILTGGLSIAKIPQMKFSGQSASERDGSS